MDKVKKKKQKSAEQTEQTFVSETYTKETLNPACPFMFSNSA